MPILDSVPSSTALDGLAAAGLDQDARAVYARLIDGPPETLPGLADAAGLSRARAEHALDRLELAGLVRRQPSRPVRFACAPPGEALRLLVLRRQEELSALRAHAAELEARFRSRLPARSSPMDLVDVIVGREAVAQRADQLHRSARADVFGLDRAPYTRPPDEASVEPALMARGVRVRTIVDVDSLSLPGRLAGLRAMAALGEEVRVMRDVPLKLLLVDREAALVPLQDDTSPEAAVAIDGAVVLHRSALLSALAAFFELLWTHAVPLGAGEPGAAPAPGPLDDLERQALALLLAGQKDDHVAHALGIGTRTLRRRLARLADGLGVRTRSQLLYELGARGWLAPEDPA